METATLARPYARAAFELARDSHAMNDWSAYLTTAAALAADPRISVLGNDPHVDPRQLAIMHQPEGMADDAAFARFLAVMADNRRLSLLADVSELFEALRRADEHTLKARLTCAEQPLPEQVEAIRKALETRHNNSVNLEISVEPDMLGGAILDIDGQVIDGSVRARLHQLQTALSH